MHSAGVCTGYYISAVLTSLLSTIKASVEAAS